VFEGISNFIVITIKGFKMITKHISEKCTYETFKELVIDKSINPFIRFMDGTQIYFKKI
jgi:hypothetical protein